MSPASWLRSTVINACGVDFSDGRPLYAYQCSDALFNTMAKTLARARQQLGARSYLDDSWDPMLCLYSAEWWRRNYESGPWSWDGIYQSLDWGKSEASERTKSIQNGLKWWKRTVQQKSGRNLYLVTIACEGGLPLRMLQRENQYLGKFFRETLREQQLTRESGVTTRQLAEDLGHILPESLRHDTVFELAGLLIDEVVRCRQLLGGATEYPLTQLDKLDADWRSRFPLRLDDDIARTLLSGLLTERVSSAMAVSADICHVARSLRRSSSELWVPELGITLPATVPDVTIRGKIGCDTGSPLPGRLELKVLVGDHEYHLALLSVSDKGIWRTQQPGAKQFGVVGLAALHDIELVLLAGPNEYARWTPDGGVALSEELPWLFLSPTGSVDEQSRVVEWAGEGAASVRESSVLIVLPAATEVPVALTGAGRLPPSESDSGRQVLIASSTVSIQLAGGEHCLVELGASDNDLPVYRIVGLRDYWNLSRKPIYRGIPRVQFLTEDGHEAVPGSQLRWRSAGRHRDPWISVSKLAPLGDVKLRHVSDKGIRFEARVIVLPSATSVDLRTKTGQPGEILLSGLGAVTCAVDSGADSEVQIYTENNSVKLIVGSDSLEQAALPVQLSWRENCGVTLALPLPIERTGFVRPDNSVLEFGSPVALEELIGLRAVVVSPTKTRGYIDLEFMDSGQHRHLTNICSFRQSLVLGTDGQQSLALGPLVPRLRQLLALSANLDSSIRITLQPGSVRDYINVRVFQSRLVVEGGAISLRNQSTQVNEAQVEMNALSIAEPGVSMTLPYSVSANGWTFESLDGSLSPWIATGRSDGVLVGRPLLIPVFQEAVVEGSLPGAIPDGVSALEDHIDAYSETSRPDALVTDALRIADYKLRAKAMENVVAEMAESPSHGAWSYFKKSLVEHTAIPPSGIDFTVRVSENPFAVCMGLFCIEEEGDLYWDTLNNLGFDFHLITLSAWVVSAQRYYRYYRAALPAGFESTALGQVVDRLELLKRKLPELDRLLELISQYLAGDHSNTMIAGQYSILMNILIAEQREKLLKDNANATWPDEQQDEEWLDYETPVALPDCPAWQVALAPSAYQAAVMAAPIHAGVQLSRDVFPTANQRSYFIAFRNFDPDWFDFVLGNVLVWGFLNRSWEAADDE